MGVPTIALAIALGAAVAGCGGSEQVALPRGDGRRPDTTPLEPGLVEQKYHARDVGPVLAVTVKGGSGGREDLVELSSR